MVLAMPTMKQPGNGRPTLVVEGVTSLVLVEIMQVVRLMEIRGQVVRLLLRKQD